MLRSSKSFKKQQIDPVKGNVNENSVIEREINLSEGRDIMKTLKGCVGFGALVVAISSTTATSAEETTGASTIHHLGKALAIESAYDASSTTSGYKWGKAEPTHQAKREWANTPAKQSGFKWGSSTTDNSEKTGVYAKSTGYKWRAMNTPTQAGYKWRSSGYKWRAVNTAETAGYKWRSSGYKWRAANTAETAGYKWRSAGYKWRAL